MPTNAEQSEMLKALISNGLDFVEKSSQELAREPKFSVAHFATGVELLLKARIFSEHWSLVSSRPHSTSWTAVKDGTFATVQASELVQTLTSLTGTPLASQGKILKTVFEHRNQALHFIPSPSLASIAAEQFRAWYHLHRLFTGAWKDIYANFSDRIGRVDELLREHATYLQVRFQELTTAKKFAAPALARKLVDCPVCGHRSGILTDADETMTDLECPVCIAALEVVNFGCGVWHCFSDGIHGTVACTCFSGLHSAQELAQIMDAKSRYGKDALIDGPSERHCGECLSCNTVVAVARGYRCFACGTRFEENETDECEWCNERWVGYDCEGTGWSGCELCDGAAGNSD